MLTLNTGNMNTVEKLEALISKAQKLNGDNRLLIEKSTALQLEVSKLKQKLDEERQKNAELYDKIKMIKLAQSIGEGNTGENELTELKRKINEYIREVDSCLAMLNE